jgi:hypothetical protein
MIQRRVASSEDTERDVPTPMPSALAALRISGGLTHSIPP